jgi:tRNA (guanine37-N1)-methyltransferase
MNSTGVRVRRTDGERVRRRLSDRRLLRAELEVVHEGEYLVFPIVPDADLAGIDGERVDRAFLAVRSRGPTDYRELVAGDASLRARLPRSFDVVGDIVLVRIPDELVDRREEIGAALLRFVPSARVVGRDLGVHGAERRRSLDRIAGSGGWRTRHRENGIDFEVDVERAYFSPRLAREHERVAERVEDGEDVYDLCCGVGPFALTIARAGHARRITAVDGNPAAIEHLTITRDRYAFADRVESRVARIEEFLPSAPPVERVVINLPHEGIKYLPSVVRAVSPRGFLHYYEITPKGEVDRRVESIMGSPGFSGWSFVDQHVVHPYAPSADLVAYLFARSG